MLAFSIQDTKYLKNQHLSQPIVIWFQCFILLYSTLYLLGTGRDLKFTMLQCELKLQKISYHLISQVKLVRVQLATR